VNEAPVLRGYLAPPPGYVAGFIPQNLDCFQYQTWVSAYRRANVWLLPDYHAPWVTEPALSNPYFWFIGRTSAILGIDPLWIYHFLYLALHIAAGYALFFALRGFTDSRLEARLALLVSFCSVPIASVLAIATFPLAKSGPLHDLLWFATRVHGRYNSDSFFNGISGSPLLLFGTVSILLCMGLLAGHLRTNSPKYLWWAGLVGAVGAFLHPFEIFIIVGAGGLALLMRRDRPLAQSIAEVARFVLPGLAGLAPHLYAPLHHAWIREAAVQSHWIPFSPPMLLALLGLPTLFCLISYAMPLGKRSVTDPLLHCWFIGVLVAFYIPWVPWAHHLLDGFFYAAAILLVRQAARSHVLRRLWVERRLLVSLSIGAWVTLSLAAHGVSLADALAGANVPGGTAVVSTTDRDVLTWLREHAADSDLVLSPKASAGLFAMVPMHSFASHWLFSLTYDEQIRLSDGFYSGALDPSAANALLTGYGVRYAVVPNGSPAARYFSGPAKTVRIGSDTIYSIPNAAMRPFTPLHR
jgi:hypothetical protein